MKYEKINKYKDEKFRRITGLKKKTYEKCGFELEFVRKNKSNPKLTKYFFIKYF